MGIRDPLGACSSFLSNFRTAFKEDRPGIIWSKFSQNPYVKEL